MNNKVFITGGAGYVGSTLVDELVKNKFEVTVLDLFIYGEDVFENKEKIKLIKGDIRNQNLLKKEIQGNDTLIHLACISNDPSFELNPVLGKSINLDSFEPLVKISKDNGIKRFIYASSSSVYGIKNVENVTENMTLKPLTDYSKYKAICEEICIKYFSKDFETVVLRPATVCGYSKRQRFDLVVNILTNLGYNKKQITVYGGKQLRPNIHIKDMINAYIAVLNQKNFTGENNVFNVGYENLSVMNLAELVKKNLDKNVEIIKEVSDDNRSYHISSKKIFDHLGFENKFSISDAINDLKIAFEKNKFIDSLINKKYFNIKMMKSINLS